MRPSDDVGARRSGNASASRTSFQGLHLRFVDAFRDMRSLDERGYRELLEIVTVIVARLHAAGLDREERP